jgi:hypothetical protein
MHWKPALDGAAGFFCKSHLQAPSGHVQALRQADPQAFRSLWRQPEPTAFETLEPPAVLLVLEYLLSTSG